MYIYMYIYVYIYISKCSCQKNGLDQTKAWTFSRCRTNAAARRCAWRPPQGVCLWCLGGSDGGCPQETWGFYGDLTAGDDELT